MPGSEHALQLYGLREIGTGLGTIGSKNPSGSMWGRVAGDSLDLATLVAVRPKDSPKANIGLAVAAVVTVTALDLACATALSNANRRQERRLRTVVSDYSRRSGFKAAPVNVRGAGRDFEIPADMRAPAALQPFS